MRFLFLLLLSGCTVQNFDKDEYSKLVTATVSLSINDCLDENTLKQKISNFSSQIEYLLVYESGLPNNQDTKTMLNGVRDETTRFNNMLITDKTMSVLYCKDKIESIRHTLSIVVQAEGHKNG